MAYKKKRKRQLATSVPNVILHINVHSNNTIVTCADANGNVLAWASSGERGFKGARKASPFAAQIAVEAVVNKISVFKIKTVEVEVNGVSANRDAVLKSLQALELTVVSIRDITPIAHNGCRPPKTRRV
ncbi:MAG: putative 30S ribosomal subunit protein S11 [Candidatus Hodgkinia cicadicola]|nr:MAG: putative 30S ribosomal subunit protein S11 [Candidatus Hodgkinia cicadicola]